MRQLLLIALVEVLAMAVWFSASAVVPTLREEWDISTSSASLLTAAVQIGFVIGAIGSAILNLADRLPMHRLLGWSAACGAVTTLAFAIFARSLPLGIALRMMTGLALAGVYPVGMKLMASWFREGRGLALGVLVGALTLGSSLPQLLRGLTTVAWPWVMVSAAVLAVAAATIAITMIRPGPFATPSPPLAPGYVIRMFRDPRQRLINLGYFGHMWELYALWTWLPAYVASSYAAWSGSADTPGFVGFTAFAAIGLAGLAGCLAGGSLADRYGRSEVTIAAMGVSASCCVLATIVFGQSPLLLIPFLLIWGAAVIADSAQFSAALSEAADSRYVGTALAAQTAIGFLITIVTIQGLPLLVDLVGWRLGIAVLALGPCLGCLAMAALRRIADQRVGAPASTVVRSVVEQ